MTNSSVEQAELNHDHNTAMTLVDESLEDAKKRRMLNYLYDQAIDEECSKSIASLIEPIGNDDNATKELIKLMYLCGEDKLLINNSLVSHQLKKFIAAMDTYTNSVIQGE